VPASTLDGEARSASPSRGTTVRRTGAHASRRNRIGLAFTLPALIVVGAILAYPLLYLLYLSFSTYRPLSSAEVSWAGLDNYVRLFTDSTVANSLVVTLQFTLASVLIEIVLGTACAILLANVMLGARGRGSRIAARLLGSAYIIPFAVPAVAGAYAWRMVLDAQFGAVNAVLGTRHALAGQLSDALDRRDRLLEDDAVRPVRDARGRHVVSSRRSTRPPSSTEPEPSANCSPSRCRRCSP